MPEISAVSFSVTFMVKLTVISLTSFALTVTAALYVPSLSVLMSFGFTVISKLPLLASVPGTASSVKLVSLSMVAVMSVSSPVPIFFIVPVRLSGNVPPTRTFTPTTPEPSTSHSYVCAVVTVA